MTVTGGVGRTLLYYVFMVTGAPGRYYNIKSKRKSGNFVVSQLKCQSDC